jgi:parvulin-like peptidyl-prolyl isomerase
MRVSSALLLAVFMVFPPVVASPAVTIDRVLATVNNDVITLSDYKKHIALLDASTGDDEVNESLLRRLIEERIILLEAMKEGFGASEDEIERAIGDLRRQDDLSAESFERRLLAKGVAMGDYKAFLRDRIISLKLIDREVNAKTAVSGGEVADYYNRNRHLFLESPEKAAVKAIFMRLRDAGSVTEITDLKIRALKIRTQLMNGGSFENMASQYADEPLKSRGGVFGEFERGALIPRLDERVQALRGGEISEPVWTEEGVYILKAERRIPARYIPMDAAKKEIVSVLYEQKRDERFNAWMNGLWEKSSITMQ